jgi:hypothetical protein
MSLRNLPRVEAERVAFQIILVEFLNRTYPDTPSDRRAWCCRSETRDSILLPMGVGARHAWLHSACRDPWAESRRKSAVEALAAMGIVEPSNR